MTRDAEVQSCDHGVPTWLACTSCEELALLEEMSVEDRKALLSRIVGWMSS